MTHTDHPDYKPECSDEVNHRRLTKQRPQFLAQRALYKMAWIYGQSTKETANDKRTCHWPST